MNQLTDEEINQLAHQHLNHRKESYGAIDFARAVIAAEHERLRQQDPVAWKCKMGSNYCGGSLVTVDEQLRDYDEAETAEHLIPLYAAPIPPTVTPSQQETPLHNDHPSRHWDRTCPACIAESYPVFTPPEGEAK